MFFGWVRGLEVNLLSLGPRRHVRLVFFSFYAFIHLHFPLLFFFLLEKFLNFSFFFLQFFKSFHFFHLIVRLVDRLMFFYHFEIIIKHVLCQVILIFSIDFSLKTIGFKLRVIVFESWFRHMGVFKSASHSHTSERWNSSLGVPSDPLNRAHWPFLKSFLLNWTFLFFFGLRWLFPGNFKHTRK